MKKRVWIFFGLSLVFLILSLALKLNKMPQNHSSELNTPDLKIEVTASRSPTPTDDDLLVRDVTATTAQLKENSNFYNFKGEVISKLLKGSVETEVFFIYQRIIDGVLTRVVPYYNIQGFGYIKLSSLKLETDNDLPNLDYIIENKKAYRLFKGQKEEIEFIQIEKTGKSGLQCFLLSDANKSKKPWEKKGSYIFDPAGKFLIILPFEEADTSDIPRFSPNEKYIAQDEGTWTLRGLNIFSFPDFRKITSIGYEDYQWDLKNDDYIYFTWIGEKQKPNCPYDPNGYHYVAAIDLKNNLNIPIKMYDDLAEYYLKELSSDNIVLKKVSINKTSEWADTSKYKETQITIPNPLMPKK